MVTTSICSHIPTPVNNPVRHVMVEETAGRQQDRPRDQRHRQRPDVLLWCLLDDCWHRGVCQEKVAIIIRLEVRSEESTSISCLVNDNRQDGELTGVKTMHVHVHVHVHICRIWNNYMYSYDVLTLSGAARNARLEHSIWTEFRCVTSTATSAMIGRTYAQYTINLAEKRNRFLFTVTISILVLSQRTAVH